jgi:hypothetical protein
VSTRLSTATVNVLTPITSGLVVTITDAYVAASEHVYSQGFEPSGIFFFSLRSVGYAAWLSDTPSVQGTKAIVIWNSVSSWHCRLMTSRQGSRYEGALRPCLAKFLALQAFRQPLEDASNCALCGSPGAGVISGRFL